MTDKELFNTFKISYRYKHSMYYKQYLPNELRNLVNSILDSSYGITLECNNIFLCLKKQWFKARLETLKIMIKYRLETYYHKVEAYRGGQIEAYMFGA